MRYGNGSIVSGPRGSDMPGAKLTEDAVRDIKSNPGISLGFLAKRYGVSRQCIANVRNGVSWGHIHASPDSGAVE